MSKRYGRVVANDSGFVHFFDVGDVVEIVKVVKPTADGKAMYETKNEDGVVQFLLEDCIEEVEPSETT